MKSEASKTATAATAKKDGSSKGRFGTKAKAPAPRQARARPRLAVTVLGDPTLDIEEMLLPETMAGKSVAAVTVPDAFAVELDANWPPAPEAVEEIAAADLAQTPPALATDDAAADSTADQIWPEYSALRPEDIDVADAPDVQIDTSWPPAASHSGTTSGTRAARRVSTAPAGSSVTPDQAAETQTATRRAAEQRASEARDADTRAAAKREEAARREEAKQLAAEKRAAEKRAAELEAAAQREAEERAAAERQEAARRKEEERAAKQLAAEKRAAEKRAAELEAAAQREAEERAAEKRAVEARAKAEIEDAKRAANALAAEKLAAEQRAKAELEEAKRAAAELDAARRTAEQRANALAEELRAKETLVAEQQEAATLAAEQARTARRVAAERRAAKARAAAELVVDPAPIAEAAVDLIDSHDADAIPGWPAPGEFLKTPLASSRDDHAVADEVEEPEGFRPYRAVYEGSRWYHEGEEAAAPTSWAELAEAQANEDNAIDAADRAGRSTLESRLDAVERELRWIEEHDGDLPKERGRAIAEAVRRALGDDLTASAERLLEPDRFQHTSTPTRAELERLLGRSRA